MKRLSKSSHNVVAATAFAAASLWLLCSCSRPDDEQVDVHGNGLTRRAERILGVDPSAPTNPLVLIPVTNGYEPYALTYQVPIRTDVESNGGHLTLLDGGEAARDWLFERQTNGTYLLYWTTLYSKPGPHTLQVELGPHQA